jgi:hypothetical protein
MADLDDRPRQVAQVKDHGTGAESTGKDNKPDDEKVLSILEDLVEGQKAILLAIENKKKDSADHEERWPASQCQRYLGYVQ